MTGLGEGSAGVAGAGVESARGAGSWFVEDGADIAAVDEALRVDSHTPKLAKATTATPTGKAKRRLRDAGDIGDGASAAAARAANASAATGRVARSGAGSGGGVGTAAGTRTVSLVVALTCSQATVMRTLPGCFA